MPIFTNYAPEPLPPEKSFPDQLEAWARAMRCAPLRDGRIPVPTRNQVEEMLWKARSYVLELQTQLDIAQAALAAERRRHNETAVDDHPGS